MIPLADVWNQLWQLKPHPFVRLLDWNLLPTAQAVTEFDAIEELTFVGYPNGLADPVNHIPIARQAITATPLFHSAGIPHSSWMGPSSAEAVEVPYSS